MSKKRQIRLVDHPSFTTWAIRLVVVLIGVTAVAIGTLLVMTAKGGPDLNPFTQSETAVRTATPRPQQQPTQSTQFTWETPTPPMGQRPTLPTPMPTPVPAKNRPTRPAKSGQTDTVVSSDFSDVHPTYQPTTEPCYTCHQEMRQPK